MKGLTEEERWLRLKQRLLESWRRGIDGDTLAEFFWRRHMRLLAEQRPAGFDELDAAMTNEAEEKKKRIDDQVMNRPEEAEE